MKLAFIISILFFLMFPGLLHIAFMIGISIMALGLIAPLFFDVRNEQQKNNHDADVQAQRAWHAANGAKDQMYQVNGTWYWK